MKRLLKRLSILINVMIVLLLLAILGAFMLKHFYQAPSQNPETVVVIPEGAGLSKVTDILAKQNLIKSPTLFKLASYYQGTENNWRFGEYKVPKNASMQEIQNVLTQGKAIELAVTLPEGLTSWEIVERLKQVPELTGEITVIPDEGSLAPNTYSFLRGSTRQEVIDQMILSQKKILETAWNDRAADSPLKSAQELLTLASIVEKETGNAEERPMVASVFVNRLRKGILLQTDPTVIYGITKGKGELGRGIRKSELVRETPYNTYVIKGLPPTAISNPGAESIKAAANPANTDYIYFVAKTLSPKDGHLFAKTLDEHNKNVAAYRALEANGG